MHFTIGSDPEAFILNRRTNEVVSPKRFTKGTKSTPEWIEDGYAILNDNILIEGNVPPASNREEFIANMSKLHEIMSDKASSRLGYIHNTDAMQISNELLMTKEAREFGCSSFRDAWNDVLEIQTPQLITNWRPAGTHIHLGFSELQDQFKVAVVRAFDIFVTMPAIEMTGFNYRTSNLYGLLGAMRFTSYGVECRSLGGTFFNPQYFGWIYDRVEEAMNFAERECEFLLDLNNITTYIPEDRFKIVNEYRNIIMNK